jgi:ribosomal subunit interface protein
MRIPVDVHFRDMSPSPAIESHIRQRIEALGRIDSTALGCHVTVEPGDHRRRHGTIHRFTIRLVVPGDEIVVSREPGANAAHEDPYVAMRDACDALERQLVEHRRQRRGR